MFMAPYSLVGQVVKVKVMEHSLLLILSLERLEALEGKARVMPRPLSSKASMSHPWTLWLSEEEEERRNRAGRRWSRRCWATSPECRSSAAGPGAGEGSSTSKMYSKNPKTTKRLNEQYRGVPLMHQPSCLVPCSGMGKKDSANGLADAQCC